MYVHSTAYDRTQKYMRRHSGVLPFFRVACADIKMLWICRNYSQWQDAIRVAFKTFYCRGGGVPRPDIGTMKALDKSPNLHVYLLCAIVAATQWKKRFNFALTSAYGWLTCLFAILPVCVTNRFVFELRAVLTVRIGCEAAKMCVKYHRSRATQTLGPFDANGCVSEWVE